MSLTDLLLLPFQSDSEDSSTESSDECTSDASEHNFTELQAASLCTAAALKCHQCGSALLSQQSSNKTPAAILQCTGTEPGATNVNEHTSVIYTIDVFHYESF